MAVPRRSLLGTHRRTDIAWPIFEVGHPDHGDVIGTRKPPLGKVIKLACLFQERGDGVDRPRAVVGEGGQTDDSKRLHLAPRNPDSMILTVNEGLSRQVVAEEDCGQPPFNPILLNVEPEVSTVIPYSDPRAFAWKEVERRVPGIYGIDEGLGLRLAPWGTWDKEGDVPFFAKVIEVHWHF